MATLPPIISRTWIEGVIVDSLGQVDTIDSLVTDNNPAPARIIRTGLAAGDNPVPVPAGSRGCIITFEETCNTNKFLKGIGADTGIQVSTIAAPTNAGTFLIPFGVPTPATFIINSVGADTGITQFTFV